MSAHSYDPYQPPVVSLEAPSPSPPGKVDVGSVYRAARASFGAQPWALTFAVVLQGAIGSFLQSGIGLATEGLHLPILGYVASFFLTTFFYVGTTRIALDAARGKKVRIATLFSGGDVLLPSLVASLVTAVAVSIGLLCAIVPGIHLALGFYFVQILIADRRLGPIEACRESLRLTGGHKWSLFKLGALSLAIGLLGLIALVVGVFPASAIAQLITVHAYLQLTGET